MRPDLKPENPSLGARPKLSEKVANEVRSLIQRGDLAPGARLPTEHAMVEQFGVSRTVIREAISALRVDGMVNAHQGRGVFVADDLTNQPFRLGNSALSRHEHLIQTMELRLSMEVANAQMAAERRDDADIAAIEAAMTIHHAAHLAGDLGKKEDFAVHLAIAEATKNSYMADFLRYLGPFIVPSSAMRQMEPSERDSYQESLRGEHTDIVAAIKDRDATTAAEGMRQHLMRGLDLNKEILLKSAEANETHGY